MNCSVVVLASRAEIWGSVEDARTLIRLVPRTSSARTPCWNWPARRPGVWSSLRTSPAASPCANTSPRRGARQAAAPARRAWQWPGSSGEVPNSVQPSDPPSVSLEPKQRADEAEPGQVGEDILPGDPVALRDIDDVRVLEQNVLGLVPAFENLVQVHGGGNLPLPVRGLSDDTHRFHRRFHVRTAGRNQGVEDARSFIEVVGAGVANCPPDQDPVEELGDQNHVARLERDVGGLVALEHDTIEVQGLGLVRSPPDQ